jgi:hypothetical protein
VKGNTASYVNRRGAFSPASTGQALSTGNASEATLKLGVMPFLLISRPDGVWYLATVTTTADPSSGSSGTICNHQCCEKRHRSNTSVFAFTGHLQHPCNEHANARCRAC